MTSAQNNYIKYKNIISTELDGKQASIPQHNEVFIRQSKTHNLIFSVTFTHSFIHSR